MPASSTFTTENDGDRTIIRVSGTFDRGSALELQERIDRASEPDLVVDFSLVRDFVDLGVAALAAELAAHPRRVALQGLRTHQLRIFRYFGVDPDKLGPAPADAEDRMPRATAAGKPQPPLAG